MSRGSSWDRVAWPDADRGDVDGALVDALAFVVTGGDGAELLELAEAAFDGVAFLVPASVECRRAAAGAAAVAAVFFWSSLTGMTAWMWCWRSQARLPAEEYALSAIARPGRRRGLPFPRR